MRAVNVLSRKIDKIDAREILSVRSSPLFGV